MECHLSENSEKQRKYHISLPYIYDHAGFRIIDSGARQEHAFIVLVGSTSCYQVNITASVVYRSSLLHKNLRLVIMFSSQLSASYWDMDSWLNRKRY